MMSSSVISRSSGVVLFFIFNAGILRLLILLSGISPCYSKANNARIIIDFLHEYPTLPANENVTRIRTRTQNEDESDQSVLPQAPTAVPYHNR
jgi:hypothetical protein